MIDKVAAALPSTGAAGVTSPASFKSALQGAGGKGAGFKAPTGPSKPGAGPSSTAKSNPNPKASGVEPGTRAAVAGPQQHAKVQPSNPAKVLSEVQRAQAKLDNLLKMAESGRTFSPAELLAFQTHAYRASQELDLASKVVEKGTSAVKQTLQTQL